MGLSQKGGFGKHLPPYGMGRWVSCAQLNWLGLHPGKILWAFLTIVCPLLECDAYGGLLLWQNADGEYLLFYGSVMCSSSLSHRFLFIITHLCPFIMLWKRANSFHSTRSKFILLKFISERVPYKCSAEFNPFFFSLIMLLGVPRSLWTISKSTTNSREK